MDLAIKIKPEAENFQHPRKGTEHSACYDAYASRIEYCEDGMVICYLGFSTEIPEGWEGNVLPRSNISKYSWVIPNSPGEIDSDYRNEWQCRFRPIPYLKDIPDSINPEKHVVDFVVNDFPYKVGERVCQICFREVVNVSFELVENTTDTERGKGGFGHTGLK